MSSVSTLRLRGRRVNPCGVALHRRRRLATEHMQVQCVNQSHVLHANHSDLNVTHEWPVHVHIPPEALADAIFPDADHCFIHPACMFMCNCFMNHSWLYLVLLHGSGCCIDNSFAKLYEVLLCSQQMSSQLHMQSCLREWMWDILPCKTLAWSPVLWPFGLRFQPTPGSAKAGSEGTTFHLWDVHMPNSVPHFHSKPISMLPRLIGWDLVALPSSGECIDMTHLHNPSNGSGDFIIKQDNQTSGLCIRYDSGLCTRCGEASKPGPRSNVSKEENFILEIANVTHLRNQAPIVAERKFHAIVVAEHSLFVSQHNGVRKAL